MTTSTTPRKYALSTARRLVAALAVALLSAACATSAVGPARPVPTQDRSALPIDAAVAACRAAIGEATSGASDVRDGLDINSIRISNWNVHKKRSAAWKSDFDALSADAELVLLQEASLREETVVGLDATRHWSFAPGFRRGREITGVLTLSTVAPMTRCNFSAREPVFRTAKATGVTQYGLDGSDSTLVVVNLHAVNFSLGLGSYRRQFGQIRRALELHDGPVIVAGDFNTWRPARRRVVEQFADDLELAAIVFDQDSRVRFLGQPLDHIYVRGLTALGADTREVTTSDHNPMQVTLSL